MKRPPRGRRRREASRNSPASELRTTSMPSPSVAARNSSVKPSSREEEMWSRGTPNSSSAPHLPGPAVAKTSAPMCRASWIAAIPTPPAPAGIRARPAPLQLAAAGGAGTGGEGGGPRGAGGEAGGRGGGRRKGPPPGEGGKGAGVGDRERAEGVGEQARHPVTRRDVRDRVAGLGEDAGAFAADRRLAGVEAEGDQHVSEVEPGGAHRDAHLAGAERPLGLGAGDRREVLQGSQIGRAHVCTPAPPI